MKKNNPPQLSIVLPIFNEEDCLEGFLSELEDCLENFNPSYEIICVDDASFDNTWPILSSFHQKNPKIKGIRLTRNFGHQLAIYAGLKESSGNYVGIMDADGQDPPEVLISLFQKCEKKFDIVYAIRKNRKENFLKKFAYKTFYTVYKKIVPFEVPLDSGDFSVFTREVADFIKNLNEKKPFIRGLRSWYGGKQIGMEYERKKRSFGKPKYTFQKLLFLAVNGAISFSKVPLRAISTLGILISLVSFLAGFTLIFMKITIGVSLQGWTSTALLIMFFGGLNLLVLGIIGEYIGDIFDEVKNRPPFLITKKLGLPSESPQNSEPLQF